MSDPVRLEPLPPEEAIAFFRKKGLAQSFAWEDVWEAEHGRAFTVAKALSREILEDIRAAVDQAITDGETLEQFRRDLTPRLQEKGWWGRQAMTDPLTGETPEVQLGSPRRLRTIFEVNMRSAYAAGRWRRIERVKAAMPYLRYTAVMDGRTRPEHRAWHGVVLPVDDPWWDTHYPPCGWRCRCTVTQMNARTLARRGYQVTAEPPRFPPRPFVNRRTGEVTVMETGVDPGFGFNVGKAWLDGNTPRPLPDAPDPEPGEGGPDGGTAAFAAGEVREGELLDRGVDLEEASAAFLGELDAGEGRVFEDVAGERLPIGPALFRRPDGRAPRWPAARLRSLNLIARAIASPDQIRECWRQDEAERRVLVRRYLASFRTPEGMIDVMAEFGRQGWRCRSSAEGDWSLVQASSPELVWRRR